MQLLRRSKSDLFTAPKPNKMPLSLSMVFAVFAGASLPLALAPYGWWWVALISPAIFYALLTKRKPSQAFMIGWAYGFGLWVVGAFWLYHSIHYFGDMSVVVSLLMMGAVGLLMGLFNAVQALLYSSFLRESPLSFAPLWVLTEWVKTWFLTGFPWLFVGYAFTEKTLDAYAPIAGVLSVSFITVLIGCALWHVLVRWQARWLLPVLALVVGAYYLNTVRFTTPKLNASGQPIALSTSLIQGNIPQDLRWLTEYRETSMQIELDLSQTEWGRDLVVWSESAIPMFQTEAKAFIDKTNQLATENGSAWVTGLPYQEEKDVTPTSAYIPFYNSLWALGSHSSGVYKKQRLVPMGEYVPLSGLLNIIPALKQDVSIMSFSAGQPNQQPLSIKGLKLGSAICYEVAYPDVTRLNARDTDFMVTVSNDAWFGTSDGPLQHLQMVQMRAKETGRYFIRATNSGVSAFIDDQGHIVSRTPQFKKAVLRGQLPAMQGMTPYMRYGDLPVLLLMSGLLLGFLTWRFSRISS